MATQRSTDKTPDVPTDDGTGAQADDPTTRDGDAGQAEPTTDPATTNTAATLETATPEKVATRKYSGPKVGAKAEHTLYGVIGGDGSTTPTGNGGRDALEPGARGTVIVQAGDTVTPVIARLLGA